MDRNKILEGVDTPLIFIDPSEVFDPCILGLAFRCTNEPVVAYDRDKVVSALMISNPGFTSEDAEEWFEHNVIGSFMGDATPVFISTNVSEE
jgi:hypothetical protein